MSTAILNWELYVRCPHCGDDVNLEENDHHNDYVIAQAIFSNQWDNLEGHEITCPKCGEMFEISEVVY